MKWKKDNKYFRWGLTAFIVIASGLLFYYFMFHGTNIKNFVTGCTTVLMPVLFGFVIAYLLTPILNYIEFRIINPICRLIKLKDSKLLSSMKRGVSIVITMVLAIAVVSGLIAMMVSQIVPSIINITNNFDSYIANFTLWINKTLENNPQVRDFAIGTIDRYSKELETWVNETLQAVLSRGSYLLKTVSLSVISILKVLWNLVIGFIISIYLLANKENFSGQAKKMVFAMFAKDTANIIINNFHFTHRTFSGFISGKVLDSIIIGCLCFLGTSILGTPYAALVSVVIGCTNVIPFFGPALGAIPTTILILLVDINHPLNAVYFLIFVLLLQQFDGNVLGPKILGDSTGLTSFWVIFAITFFGGLFGILGMIVGVPLFAVVYAAVRSYIHASLKNKNLPENTDLYINVSYIDNNNDFHQYTPEYKLNKEEKKSSIFGTEFISKKSYNTVNNTDNNTDEET